LTTVMFNELADIVICWSFSLFTHYI
jgi:hypothetical protein